MKGVGEGLNLSLKVIYFFLSFLSLGKSEHTVAIAFSVYSFVVVYVSSIMIAQIHLANVSYCIRERERERERERQRKTDRDRERQKDRERERQRERKIEKHRQTQEERHAHNQFTWDRQMERDAGGETRTRSVHRVVFLVKLSLFPGIAFRSIYFHYRSQG